MCLAPHSSSSSPSISPSADRGRGRAGDSYDFPQIVLVFRPIGDHGGAMNGERKRGSFARATRKNGRRRGRVGHDLNRYSRLAPGCRNSRGGGYTFLLLGFGRSDRCASGWDTPVPRRHNHCRLAWSFNSLAEGSKAFGHPQSFVAAPHKNGVQLMAKDSKNMPPPATGD
jgi:hypothetical protein